MRVKIIDRFGGFASAACVVHCLLVSVGATFLSTLELGDSFQEIFEWSFFGLAVFFALMSATVGFKAFQKSWLLACFSVGLLILIAGRMSEFLELFEYGDVLSIVGGFTLFISHLLSLRCC